jgi:hypothetical protein
VPAIQVDVAYGDERGFQPREGSGYRSEKAAPVIQPVLHAAGPEISAEADQVDRAVIVEIGRHPAVRAFIAGGGECLLVSKTTRAVVEEDVHLRLSASGAAAEGAGAVNQEDGGIAVWHRHPQQPVRDGVGVSKFPDKVPVKLETISSIQLVLKHLSLGIQLLQR